MKKILTKMIFSIIGHLRDIPVEGGQTMGNRIEELVIYISEKSKNDPNYGKTKLNKILFAADFYYYGYYGKSISEVKYVHIDRGPAPKAMAPVLERLSDSKKITIIPVDRYGRTLQKVTPLVKPDMSKFSKEEIDFIDTVIDRFKDYNGTELSNWTHTLVPWLVTTTGEEIPYESIFVINHLPVDQDGLNWAREELTRLRETAEYAH